MIRIHNANTGEIIDREMTDAEFAEHQIGIKKMQARITASQAKAQTKAALLAQLGITEEQAKLLLS